MKKLRVLFLIILTVLFWVSFANAATNPTNICTAVSATGSTPSTLLVDTPQTLTCNLTIPSTMTLKIERNGLITTTGYRMTVYGTIDAGLYQVFSGTGKVTFGPGATKEVHPEWWGAKADNGTTDNTTAFNVAINLNLPVKLSAGTYWVNAVHTTGNPVIRGAGTNATFLKSYSSTGYAWYEQQYSGDWNRHAVFHDLSFLGDSAGRNGFVFGDPVTYTANMEYAGRCLFNNVHFINLAKAVYKPWGNIGNTFNSCDFIGGNYHYHAVGISSMHPGCDTFNNCHFTASDAKSIYIVSPTIGAGQTVFNQCIIEGNRGWAVYVDGYLFAINPLRFNDCWFEGNTNDVYLKNVSHALFDGCGTVNYTLISSAVTEKNAYISGDIPAAVSADSTSAFNSYDSTFYMARYSDRTVFSYGHSYGVGGLNSDVNKILPRTSIVYSPAKLGGDSFSEAGPWWFGGTPSGVNATQASDGILYSTCAELALTGAHTLVYGTLFTHSVSKWYVWSMDVKMMTTGKPDYLGITGPVPFSRNLANALVKDKWVSIGGICRGNDGNSYPIYIKNTSDITVRFSALQIVEFDTEQEAISYFNNQTFSGP